MNTNKDNTKKMNNNMNKNIIIKRIMTDNNNNTWNTLKIKITNMKIMDMKIKKIITNMSKKDKYQVLPNKKEASKIQIKKLITNQMFLNKDKIIKFRYYI